MNTNIETDQRPKRTVSKPTRYLTTSSDEGPRKRMRVAPGNLQNDLLELRATLEDGNDDYTPDTHAYQTQTDAYPTQTYAYLTQTHAYPTQTHATDTHSHIPHTQTYTHIPYTDSPTTSTYGLHTAQTDISRPHSNITKAFSVPGAAGGQQCYLRADHDCGKPSENTQTGDLNRRMEAMESMMTKMQTTLETILRQQQQLLRQHTGVPSKPGFFPISSEAGMTEFQDIDEDGYRKAVNYLEYVGGYNLKEAVTLCFKEIFCDQLLTSYSWLGREDNKGALCEARVVRAIHDAVLHSRHFPMPSRREVADAIKVALRTAKERVRSQKRGPRRTQRPIEEDFWAGDE